MEDDSVVGDRGTDVELVPVHTLRSHDWTELGPDPMKGINYVDFYSEAIADFVAMEDDVHDRKEWTQYYTLYTTICWSFQKATFFFYFIVLRLSLYTKLISIVRLLNL